MLSSFFTLYMVFTTPTVKAWLYRWVRMWFMSLWNMSAVYVRRIVVLKRCRATGMSTENMPRTDGLLSGWENAMVRL